MTDTLNDTSTLDAERLRNALVDQLVANEHVRTPRIQAAMRTVPRHVFVPKAPLAEAYANTTVTIKRASDGTSISCASQPSIVALMLEQLQAQPGDNILELGAGTGYNAGLLGHLVGEHGHVTTLDVDDDLVDGARAHLAAAGIGNVMVVRADGALGHRDGAPYDRVIASVGAHGIPLAWMDQLAPGGRLLVSQRLRGSVCRSIAYEHHSDGWVSVSSAMNTFMPLRGGIAADDRHRIPISSEPRVWLQTTSEQAADDDALAGVLDQPRTVVWAEVYYRARESAEWMELWLACALPSGLNRMIFSKDAAGGVLTEDPYPSSTAAFDRDALTYLARRPSHRRSSEGDKLWEFGVAGHGPGSDDLAARVVDAMRTWDRDYRGREARFHIQALDSAPVEPRAGVFSVTAPPNRLVVEWL